MIIRIQVIKVYDVTTEGGDTTDPESVKAHIETVEGMQSTEIEQQGKLVQVTTECAEVVGPDDDDWLDHSVHCAGCGKLMDERNAARNNKGEEVCPDCSNLNP